MIIFNNSKIAQIKLLNNWGPHSLNELTHYILNTDLTDLDLEASNLRLFQFN